jgi:hypothetical protein
VDHFGTRVSSTLAASNRYVRSMASPHFEIRPDQSTSPEAWRRVVQSDIGPTLLDRSKRAGLSIVALKQSAVIGPSRSVFSRIVRPFGSADTTCGHDHNVRAGHRQINARFDPEASDRARCALR